MRAYDDAGLPSLGCGGASSAASREAPEPTAVSVEASEEAAEDSEAAEPVEVSDEEVARAAPVLTNLFLGAATYHAAERGGATACVVGSAEMAPGTTPPPQLVALGVTELAPGPRAYGVQSAGGERCGVAPGEELVYRFYAVFGESETTPSTSG